LRLELEISGHRRHRTRRVRRPADAAIDERVVRGGTLYVTDGCHACHSTDGSKDVGPTFRDLAAHRSDAQIVRGIAHHIALTPPSPALVALAHRRADVRALADFIETISATKCRVRVGR
jgi:cytochrome c551/c552